MQTDNQSSARRAFTRADLCAVLVTISLLTAIALPALAKIKPQGERVSCLNNLRQLGVGWHSWAKENSNQPPWYVMPADGGTKTIGIPYVHFLIISNYVVSPMVMVCPTDTIKIPARDFSDDPNRGFRSTNFQNNAVGYFIGTENVMDDPRPIMAGDRNVPGTLVGNCGAARFPTARLANGFWLKGSHNAGMGNLLFCDGSARTVNDAGIRQAVMDNPVDGNRSGCFLPP
jgi:prepilin-type processing-associated H-X9-DG protein